MQIDLIRFKEITFKAPSLLCLLYRIKIIFFCEVENIFFRASGDTQIRYLNLLCKLPFRVKLFRVAFIDDKLREQKSRRTQSKLIKMLKFLKVHTIALDNKLIKICQFVLMKPAMDTTIRYRKNGVVEDFI